MSCKSNVLFVKSIVLATFLTILYSKKDGSSVKCVDAFRNALTQEPKLLIKQKYGWDSQLSILFSSSFIENLFVLRLRKSADKGLKNHYIISRKIPITNDKNTHMKQVYNQQDIN